MTGSRLLQIGKPLLLPALGLLFRSLYVWQLIILESDKKMMLQENPRMPFEVLFQFIGEAFPSGLSNTYTEVFWGESADDVRNTVMAGTTSNHIHIVEIKEKKS